MTNITSKATNEPNPQCLRNQKSWKRYATALAIVIAVCLIVAWGYRFFLIPQLNFYMSSSLVSLSNPLIDSLIGIIGLGMLFILAACLRL